KTLNIVDTPGTNAIVREHEALTSEFIPRSDLVLFVTSADRPFTESERGFLNEIKNWGKKIVLVLNKVDILENSADVEKVLAFVKENAIKLLGSTPTIFAVSSRKAITAKSGNPRLWQESGFEAVEDFIFNTLDDAGRFALKLNNPLGVGQKLISQQLGYIQEDLDSLSEDTQLLDDIDKQTLIYNDDMQRNFEARLGEVDNELYEMQNRGNDFFDEILRIGRIPDLVRRDRIQQLYEHEVVADTPNRIEIKVGELIDWMVEQDLRQWTAVADHLQKRRDKHNDRIVGEGGPREGSLAFDRQRLVDSIGLATRQAVATYDKSAEARKMAENAREAVVGTGIAGIASVAGIGIAIAGGLHLAFFDVTGVLTGLAGLTIGLLVLPSRKRKAKKQLADNLAELRSKLMSGLRTQFEREMQRSSRRLEDTIAPFSRFVRAEQEKINSQREKFIELEAHIVGLKSQTKALASTLVTRGNEAHDTA
ncbi:MAG TPA: dynamin, partial [Anaerolineae bacterium]|nr:dynamin [Anaerolineae bacterium]